MIYKRKKYLYFSVSFSCTFLSFVSSLFTYGGNSDEESAIPDLRPVRHRGLRWRDTGGLQRQRDETNHYGQHNEGTEEKGGNGTEEKDGEGTEEKGGKGTEEKDGRETDGAETNGAETNGAETDGGETDGEEVLIYFTKEIFGGRILGGCGPFFPQNGGYVPPFGSRPILISRKGARVPDGEIVTYRGI